MTEANTAATKAKTTKAASSFGLSDYGIPKFEMPKMEMPAEFREITEQGIAQARDAYETARAAAEEATDLLKNTYVTAAKGATDYNLKVIEIARTNANTTFDCMQEMLGVKSPSEFVELSTSHARKQFEAMTAQTKELTELAQKITTETATQDWRHGDTNALNKITRS